MKVQYFLLAFMVTVLGVLSVGCASTGKVGVEKYTDSTLPPTVGTIDVFTDEGSVTREFDSLGRLVFEGRAGDDAKARQALTEESRKLGADAIILDAPEKKVFFDARGYRETVRFGALAIGYTD